jgi:hypothetical protein
VKEVAILPFSITIGELLVVNSQTGRRLLGVGDEQMYYGISLAENKICVEKVL